MWPSPRAGGEGLPAVRGPDLLESKRQAVAGGTGLRQFLRAEGIRDRAKQVARRHGSDPPGQSRCKVEEIVMTTRSCANHQVADFSDFSVSRTPQFRAGHTFQ